MKYKNFIRNFFVTSLALMFIGCGGINSRLTDGGVNSRLERLALYAKKCENNEIVVDSRDKTDEIACFKYTDLNFNGKVDSKDKIEIWYGSDLLENLGNIPSFAHYVLDIGLDKIPEKDIVVYMGIPKDFGERKDLYEKTLNRIEALFDIKK